MTVRYPGTGSPEDECPPASDEESALTAVDIEAIAQKVRDNPLPSLLSLMPVASAYETVSSSFDDRITPLSVLDRLKFIKADWVQWNFRKTENGLYLGRDCKDHPAVRGTDYMEIHRLLGTSGCSTEFPHYNWEVMGVIENIHGKQVVSPGNWIGTLLPGVHVVMTDEEHRSYMGESSD